MKRKFIIKEIVNNSSGCVLLDNLNGEYYSKDKFRIHLTLNFNEESCDVIGGHIQYGLNRANLSFELDNCSMPFTDRHLVVSLEKTLQVEREHRSNTTDNRLASPEAVNSTKLSPNSLGGQLHTKSASKISEGHIEEVTNRFKTLVATFSALGDQDNPQWIIRSSPGSSYLIGCLYDEDLGLITIDDIPLTVKVSVRVRPRDVTITATEGILPNERSINKSAVIHALVWHILLKKKFSPFVSSAELLYDDEK